MPIFGIKWACYQTAKKSPGIMGTADMLWAMKRLGGRDVSQHETGHPMMIEFWHGETAFAALELIAEEYDVSLFGSGWRDIPDERLAGLSGVTC